MDLQNILTALDVGLGLTACALAHRVLRRQERHETEDVTRHREVRDRLDVLEGITASIRVASRIRGYRAGDPEPAAASVPECDSPDSEACK